MNMIYSCMIAVSMYSKIPVPTVEWSRERMRYVMCFFPLVGIAEGIILWLFLYGALEIFNLSPVTASLAGAAVPVLVTGGIHMDGFLDTCDALHSYADRDRRLEILKDPHLGAFAVISFAVYLMLYTGILHEYLSLALLRGKETRILLYLAPALVFVMERAFSGLSVVSFPQARENGLAAGFGGAAQTRTNQAALAMWLTVCLGAGAVLGVKGCRGAGMTAVILLGVHLAVFFWYYRMASEKFGGVTGDLAGCFLQVCELAGLAVSAVLLKAGILGGM